MSKKDAASSTSTDESTIRPTTWLVRIGSSSALHRPALVIPLDEHARVELGREDPELRGDIARIEVDDRWMSARHAQIERTSEGWRLSDLGSSNGTLVWSRRRSTHLLANGDVFETGTTFWMFRSLPRPAPPPPRPVGSGVVSTVSPLMADLLEKLEKVAKSRIPIVFTGATGTGKEVLAREAHRLSGREGKLMALDVGTIPPALASSELFGVATGVDGAERPRPGRLRVADGGTVLLDQIGDMAAEVQVALLRVIQSGEITPMGSDTPVQIDVRFIATTHEDVDDLVASGKFRSDLWSRLKGYAFFVPPLKDRLEDLGLLIARFLEKMERSEVTLSPAAYRALLNYPWPNNVRQLEQAIEASAALAGGDRIDLTDLPPEVQSFRLPEPSDQRPSEEDRERELVRLLTAHRGNVSAVARSMGYSRMQVHRWMKQMKVDPNAFRAS